MLTSALLAIVFFYVMNWIRNEIISNQPINQLPRMIMIDDTLYQYTTKLSEEPEEPEDGTIKVILKKEVPYEHEQANFGEEGMKYWRVEDYIIVKGAWQGNILKFEEKWY